MRLLFLSTWFPYPPDNGSKIRAYYLLRALADAHEVRLVAFDPNGANLNSDPSGRGLDLQGVDAVPVDPFRYVTVPAVLKFCSPIPVASWPSSQMRQAVRKAAESALWDAVVAIQAPVARYAKQLPLVPGILDVDTAMSYQSYERHCSRVSSPGRVRTWISWQKTQGHESRLYCRFRACTVVSPAEVGHVEALTRRSGCRVAVIPNGVDCEHNRPGLVGARPSALVYNGALTYSANYDAMRWFSGEVYQAIRQQVPAVSLTITGLTEGVNLAGLALDESVRLTGYVDDIRVPVAGATVCVVPLRQGGGTRIKILEAMALGTPVVATSKGAEGLDVTPEHDILLADEPAAFAAQVLRLLSDGGLRERLSTNARRLVEGKYDWRNIGRRFVDLVEEVAARRGATDRAG
jgi:polysaccharide biosynthesis protein PslH